MSIESKIDMLAADAEAFRGDALDCAKKIRVDAMKRICEQIVTADPRVEFPFMPWDNHSRHAGVQLRFPSVSFLEDRTEIDYLSALFCNADHVFLSAPEDGGILMTFDVADIWKEFHYEYDKK